MGKLTAKLLFMTAFIAVVALLFTNAGILVTNTRKFKTAVAEAAKFQKMIENPHFGVAARKVLRFHKAQIDSYIASMTLSKNCAELKGHEPTLTTGIYYLFPTSKRSQPYLTYCEQKGADIITKEQRRVRTLMCLDPEDCVQVPHAPSVILQGNRDFDHPIGEPTGKAWKVVPRMGDGYFIKGPGQSKLKVQSYRAEFMFTLDEKLKAKRKQTDMRNYLSGDGGVNGVETPILRFEIVDLTTNESIGTRIITPEILMGFGQNKFGSVAIPFSIIGREGHRIDFRGWTLGDASITLRHVVLIPNFLTKKKFVLRGNQDFTHEHGFAQRDLWKARPNEKDGWLARRTFRNFKPDTNFTVEFSFLFGQLGKARGRKTAVRLVGSSMANGAAVANPPLEELIRYEVADTTVNQILSSGVVRNGDLSADQNQISSFLNFSTVGRAGHAIELRVFRQSGPEVTFGGAIVNQLPTAKKRVVYHAVDGFKHASGSALEGLWKVPAGTATVAALSRPIKLISKGYVARLVYTAKLKTRRNPTILHFSVENAVTGKVVASAWSKESDYPTEKQAQSNLQLFFATSGHEGQAFRFRVVSTGAAEVTIDGITLEASVLGKNVRVLLPGRDMTMKFGKAVGQDWSVGAKEKGIFGRSGRLAFSDTIFHNVIAVATVTGKPKMRKKWTGNGFAVGLIGGSGLNAAAAVPGYGYIKKKENELRRSSIEFEIFDVTANRSISRSTLEAWQIPKIGRQVMLPLRFTLSAVQRRHVLELRVSTGGDLDWQLGPVFVD